MRHWLLLEQDLIVFRDMTPKCWAKQKKQTFWATMATKWLAPWLGLISRTAWIFRFLFWAVTSMLVWEFADKALGLTGGIFLQDGSCNMGSKFTDRLRPVEHANDSWSCIRSMDHAHVQLDFILTNLRACQYGAVMEWFHDCNKFGLHGFHNFLRKFLSKTSCVTCNSLEVALVKGGVHHGNCRVQVRAFAPSVQLKMLQQQRTQKESPESRKQLTFTIRKLKRKEVKEWKAVRIDEWLGHPCHWRHLRSLNRKSFG